MIPVKVLSTRYLANASPDRSYFEHEFALDMAKRIKAVLEAGGVKVIYYGLDFNFYPAYHFSSLKDKKRQYSYRFLCLISLLFFSDCMRSWD